MADELDQLDREEARRWRDSLRLRGFSDGLPRLTRARPDRPFGRSYLRFEER